MSRFGLVGTRLVKACYEKVTVLAPARLHMGFIDLSGALGRDFGSIGVGLDDIYTRLSISSAKSLTAAGPAAEKAMKYARRLCLAVQAPENFIIEVQSAIPEHIGLGSGTQIALAVGMALDGYFGLDLTPRQIAMLTNRGARSGIGIGVFERGGLVVDGGRGSETGTPPLLVHLPVQADWRFVLVFDQRGQGLHGDQEIKAFKRLPPFPRREAERLCYLLLMQALPAVAEGDLSKFGEVISSLQTAVGKHFAPVQGGIFTSSEVALAMNRLEQLGAVAIGQTSWGPTGFCMIHGEERAKALVTQLQREFRASPLSFMALGPNNRGAEVYFE